LLRQLLMEAAHALRDGGHRGEPLTIDRVRLGYYWPGMTSDISAFVHRCPLCQRVKAKLPAKEGLLSLTICSSPNKRLHIDLYGPLKTSAAGNHYVVFMTDTFTKYVELAAIFNKTEDQVAKVLFERWFCRFSAPTMMVLDQGKEFCNELVNRLGTLWDVDKRTWPYHPQTNSSARVIQPKHEKVHHGDDGRASTHGLGGLVALNNAVLQLSRAQGHGREPLLSHVRTRSETSIF
jgi:hypothetical protein